MANAILAKRASQSPLNAPLDLTEFRKWMLGLGRCQGTVDDYVKTIGWVASELGSDPATWGPEECNALIQTARWANWSPGTHCNVRAALKRYWQFRTCEELLGPKNIAFFLDKRAPGGMDRYQALKDKAPSQAEVEKIRRSCRDAILTSKSPGEIYRHYQLLLIANYGLRRSEICNLNLGDVKLDKKMITVLKSKGEKSREVHLDIPLDDMHKAFLAARRAIIEDLISNNPEMALALEDLKENTAAPLFFTRARESRKVGSRLDPSAVAESVRRLNLLILGRSVRPHGLRHSKVFELVETPNLDRVQVQRYLGHSKSDTLLGYYYSGAAEQAAAFDRARGNATSAPSYAPAPVSTFKDKVAALAELLKAGIIDQAAFAAGVAALSGVGA